jgi:TPR repeat protein
MKRGIRAILVCTAMGLAAPLVAETPEEGRDWHRPDDYARAADYFLALACRGNAAAQETLGLLYAEGQGVARDDIRAHRWLSRALAQAEGAAAVRLRARLAEIEANMNSADIARARSPADPCPDKNQA